MWLIDEDKKGKKWDTARISKMIKKINLKEMRVKGLTVQRWRDMTITISRKYLKKKFGGDEEDEKDINEDDIENI